MLLLLQSLVPPVCTMLRSASLVVLTIALFAAVASACDHSCLCKKAGGEWRPAVGQWLKPACRIYYNHQGVHSAGLLTAPLWLLAGWLMPQHCTGAYWRGSAALS